MYAHIYTHAERAWSKRIVKVDSREVAAAKRRRRRRRRREMHDAARFTRVYQATAAGRGKTERWPVAALLPNPDGNARALRLPLCPLSLSLSLSLPSPPLAALPYLSSYLSEQRSRSVGPTPAGAVSPSLRFPSSRYFRVSAFAFVVGVGSCWSLVAGTCVSSLSLSRRARERERERVRFESKIVFREKTAVVQTTVEKKNSGVRVGFLRIFRRTHTLSRDIPRVLRDVTQSVYVYTRLI